MAKTVIYHNPRCSKSRATLQLLQENGVEPRIVDYLKTPPTAAELDTLLTRLDRQPRDVMRTREPAYAENGLADPNLTRAQLIDAMVANPILIERPIVTDGRKAVIGRPPENVLDLI